MVNKSELPAFDAIEIDYRAGKLRAPGQLERELQKRLNCTFKRAVGLAKYIRDGEKVWRARNPGEGRAQGFAKWMVKKFGYDDGLRRVKLRAAAPESKSEGAFWPRVAELIETGAYKNPAKRRGRRRNFGEGSYYKFHGSFTDKAKAVAKEFERPGSFIKEKYVRGQKRFVVMSKKNSRRRAGKSAGKLINKLERAIAVANMRGDKAGVTKFTKALEQALNSTGFKHYAAGAVKNPDLYDAIRPYARVTIVNRFGQERTGRAVMLGPAGWVLNMGGPHGTPAIASPENVTRVKLAKRNAGRQGAYSPHGTIPKSRTKLIDAIFANARDAKVYTLENYYRGKPVDPKYAKKALYEFSFAKLHRDGGDRYRVRVHDREWYEFESPQPNRRKNKADKLGSKAAAIREAMDASKQHGTAYVYDNEFVRGPKESKLFFVRFNQASPTGKLHAIAKAGKIVPASRRNSGKVVKFPAGRSLAAAFTDWLQKKAFWKQQGYGSKRGHYRVWAGTSPKSGHLVSKVAPWNKAVKKAFADVSAFAAAAAEHKKQNPKVTAKRHASRASSTSASKKPGRRAAAARRNTDWRDKFLRAGGDEIYHGIKIEHKGGKWLTPQLQKSPGKAATFDSKQEAKQFIDYYAKRRNGGRRRNQDEAAEAAELYRKFHGKEADSVEEIEDPYSYPEDYAKLGDLVSLQIGGKKGHEISFEDDDEVILASNAKGTQLYFIGGNQDVSEILAGLKVDKTKHPIVLGECTQVEYRTQKKFDNFEEVTYYHELGEETGERPLLVFDQLNNRLGLVGGAYKVKPEGITN